MNIILDSANIDEIRKWSGILSTRGITTNPRLLRQAHITLEDDFKEFIDIVDAEIKNQTVFFQCFSIEDISSLKDTQDYYNNTAFVAKISMLPQYYPLIEKAKSLNIQTAATTCYDLIQINQACLFNMDYCMVYFAKNDDQNLMGEAVKLKKDYNYKTTLVAASFRTKADVIEAIKSGIDYATIPPDILELAYKNVAAQVELDGIFGV